MQNFKTIFQDKIPVTIDEEIVSSVAVGSYGYTMGYTGLRLFQVLKCGRTDIRELISQPARARLVSLRSESLSVIFRAVIALGYFCR